MTDPTIKGPADYTNEAQQRICEMLRVLAGNEFTGLAPSQIAKAMNVSASVITRDLFNLQKAGFAEPLGDTGRWRLGPKLVQIGLAFMTHSDEQRRLLEETHARYTRKPT